MLDRRTRLLSLLSLEQRRSAVTTDPTHHVEFLRTSVAPQHLYLEVASYRESVGRVCSSCGGCGGDSRSSCCREVGGGIDARFAWGPRAAVQTKDPPPLYPVAGQLPSARQYVHRWRRFLVFS